MEKKYSLFISSVCSLTRLFFLWIHLGNKKLIVLIIILAFSFGCKSLDETEFSNFRSLDDNLGGFKIIFHEESFKENIENLDFICSKVKKNENIDIRKKVINFSKIYYFNIITNIYNSEELAEGYISILLRKSKIEYRAEAGSCLFPLAILGTPVASAKTKLNFDIAVLNSDKKIVKQYKKNYEEKCYMGLGRYMKKDLVKASYYKTLSIALEDIINGIKKEKINIRRLINESEKDICYYNISNQFNARVCNNINR